MVDFNGIKTFLFDLSLLRIHQNRWQLVWSSAPDPTRVAHSVLNTAGEDGHEGTMNLPPISISWLRHCGKFKSNQKLSFWSSKMHQNRWWLGLRPRPCWRSLQRSPDPLAVRREGRGLCDFAPQPQLPGYATAPEIRCIHTAIYYDLTSAEYEMTGGWGWPPSQASNPTI